MPFNLTYLFKICCIICCTITLSSCSFNTQNKSKSPYFDGILKLNGKPINNAKIMLSLNNDKFCYKAKKTTSTNKQGSFSLKALTKEQNYTPFVNYELNEWTVCANYKGKITRLYSNNYYGSGNVSGSVYLDCDLALRPVDKPCVISH